MDIKSKRRKNDLVWLMGLLLLCASIRLYVIANSTPIISPDSPSYIMLADQIAQHNFLGDNGSRMPLYPIFILLAGRESSNVRFWQMVLGLIIVVAIFGLVRVLGGNTIVAFISAACYGLNLSQVKYEADVLTETLTTFWLIFSVLLFTLCWRKFKAGSKPVLPLAAMGIVSAFAGCTRPVFAILPFLLCAAMFLGVREFRKWALVAIPACILPAIIMMGGWSAYNFMRFGYFGPTTLTGFNLTNHSGAFIEYAPDRYRVLRDTYLQERQKMIASTGTHSMTIWRITDKLQSQTGLTYAQLSSEFTRLSIELFIAHPDRYVMSVTKSWIQFWNAPGWYQWESAYDAGVGRGLGIIWRVQKYMVVLCNFLFLLLVGFTVTAIICKLRIREVLDIPFAVMMCVVMAMSVIQALMEYGENTRYAVPFQPLIVCIILTLGIRIYKWKFRHQLGAQQ